MIEWLWIVVFSHLFLTILVVGLSQDCGNSGQRWTYPDLSCLKGFTTINLILSLIALLVYDVFIKNNFVSI